MHNCKNFNCYYFKKLQLIYATICYANSSSSSSQRGQDSGNFSFYFDLFCPHSMKNHEHNLKLPLNFAWFFAWVLSASFIIMLLPHSMYPPFARSLLFTLAEFRISRPYLIMLCINMPILQKTFWRVSWNRSLLSGTPPRKVSQ